MKVKVIGAGLAGSEAAWQLANRGIKVELYEMRPVKLSDPMDCSPPGSSVHGMFQTW